MRLSSLKYLLIPLITLLAISSASAILGDSNSVIILQGGGSVQLGNDTFWFNDSSPTLVETPYDVQINGDLDLNGDLDSYGNAIFSSESGIVAGFLGDTIFSGDITQNGADAIATFAEVNIDENLTVNLAIHSTHGPVCDDNYDICVHENRPEYLNVTDIGEDTYNVSWTNVNGDVVWDTFTDQEGSNYYVTGISVSEDGDNQTITLNRNGGLGDLTAWFIDNNTGGGGGNPFDQWLNTSDHVNFTSLTLNQTFLIENNGVHTLDDPSSIMTINGRWIGGLVFGALDFQPQIDDGNFFGFLVRPLINTSDRSYALAYRPTWGDSEAHDFTLLNSQPAAKQAGEDYTYTIYEEANVARTAINDPSTIEINGIKMGGNAFIGNFGGGAPTFEEYMIELQGGATAIGSGATVWQRGLIFDGFGDNGTNVDTKALVVEDGGVFDFEAADRFIIPVETANHTSPVDGQMFCNTNSNGCYMYVEGSWRTLTSW